MGEGSQEAFTQLVQVTRTWATAHAFALVRDRARAEDCVQQTYIEVWSNAHRFDGTRGGAKGWILTVLRHRALDEIRATESDRRRLEHFESREYRWSDVIDSTSETAHARLDGLVVRQALTGLDADERELITLSYWAGMSHSQIAQRLDLPLGTVKTRLRRGLQRLREHVVIEWAEPGPGASHGEASRSSA